MLASISCLLHLLVSQPTGGFEVMNYEFEWYIVSEWFKYLLMFYLLCPLHHHLYLTSFFFRSWSHLTSGTFILLSIGLQWWALWMNPLLLLTSFLEPVANIHRFWSSFKYMSERSHVPWMYNFSVFEEAKNFIYIHNVVCTWGLVEGNSLLAIMSYVPLPSYYPFIKGRLEYPGDIQTFYI